MFNIKIKFRFPTHKKVLIYDNASLRILNRLIDTKKTFILSTRFVSTLPEPEIIYLTVILKVLLENKFKFSKKKYIEKIIELVKPKIAITSIDNDIFFWTLKKRFPKLQTIFIQNGFRDDYLDIFKILKKTKKKQYAVDKMFVFSNIWAKKYKEYINGKTVVLGSVMNNECPIKKSKKIGLLIISELNEFRLSQKNQIYYPEHKNSEFLDNYCHKNKIPVTILLRTDHQDVIDFYIKKFKKNKINFELPKKPLFYNTDSYRIVDKAKVIVSVSSTLGYEAFSRNNRVAFFSFRGEKLIQKSFNFGWPRKTSSNNGLIWSNVSNDKYFIKILHYLFKVEEQKWKKDLKKLSKYGIARDEGNKLFYKHTGLKRN
jgi:surface carbohydrate biosynthesis protein